MQKGRRAGYFLLFVHGQRRDFVGVLAHRGRGGRHVVVAVLLRGRGEGGGAGVHRGCAGDRGRLVARGGAPRADREVAVGGVRGEAVGDVRGGQLRLRRGAAGSVPRDGDDALPPGLHGHGPDLEILFTCRRDYYASILRIFKPSLAAAAGSYV